MTEQELRERNAELQNRVKELLCENHCSYCPFAFVKRVFVYLLWKNRKSGTKGHRDKS